MRNDRNRKLAALGIILLGGVDAAWADTVYSVMPFEVPGSAPWTQAVGINDSGQIVGLYDTLTAEYGFLYAGGAFTTISVPGAQTTDATGINDRGQVVGVYEYDVGNIQHINGFIDSDGALSTF